ncbi:YkvA family protein [Methylomagnum ishizawai]|nr:DUF1232 domain-containing protein [Methylomagnum ishizawai]
MDKLRDLPVGGEIAARALRLLKLLRDDRVPVWVKAIVTGALGYLILPWDVSPDFLPWIGYLDDAAALAAALALAEESLDG